MIDLPEGGSGKHTPHLDPELKHLCLVLRLSIYLCVCLSSSSSSSLSVHLFLPLSPKRLADLQRGFSVTQGLTFGETVPESVYLAFLLAKPDKRRES